VLAQGVRVTRREGGEGMYLAGRTGRQSLKKLLQESAIPPWERDRLLLLRVGNDTAEVLGLWRDRRYTVGANETGLVVERRPLG
jgi:tRNA(Ile)-lysidine synthase